MDFDSIHADRPRLSLVRPAVPARAATTPETAPAPSERSEVVQSPVTPSSYREDVASLAAHLSRSATHSLVTVDGGALATDPELQRLANENHRRLSEIAPASIADHDRLLSRALSNDDRVRGFLRGVRDLLDTFGDDGVLGNAAGEPSVYSVGASFSFSFSGSLEALYATSDSGNSFVTRVSVDVSFRLDAELVARAEGPANSDDFFGEVADRLDAFLPDQLDAGRVSQRDGEFPVESILKTVADIVDEARAEFLPKTTVGQGERVHFPSLEMFDKTGDGEFDAQDVLARTGEHASFRVEASAARPESGGGSESVYRKYQALSLLYEGSTTRLSEHEIAEG